MNLPAKISGNSMKGMTRPIALRMALLWGYLQINSYDHVTEVKAFMNPFTKVIAAAPRSSLTRKVFSERIESSACSVREIFYKKQRNILCNEGNGKTVNIIDDTF